MAKSAVKSRHKQRSKRKNSRLMVDFGKPKVPITSKFKQQHEKLSDWQHAS